MKEETLYRKVGRRYKPVGINFAGFPANGLWFVLDGRRSQIMRLDEIKSDLPLSAVTFREKLLDLETYLARELISGEGFSIRDVAKLACDFFAKVSDGDLEIGKTW